MNYADLRPIDVANGPGIRVSLFVSGCTHHCRECFNPETWDFGYGAPFTDGEVQAVLNHLAPGHIRGLSLLGGEPLDPKNGATMIGLCYSFKHYHPDKDIWCYTGYDWEQIKHLYILNYIDVLVDGKFI
jgi:anaerobic ribonucleoside-triphosphate reductase activating protein